MLGGLGPAVPVANLGGVPGSGFRPGRQRLCRHLGTASRWKTLSLSAFQINKYMCLDIFQVNLISLFWKIMEI